MKKLFKNPLILFALAIVLIAGSSVGAASAAFVYTTQAQQVNFSTAQISVELLEAQSKEVDGSLVADTDNYKSVSQDTGLTYPCINQEDFKIGVKYPEVIAVRNNSNDTTGYSEYVRVIVTKSWQKDGKKDTTLSPELINLETDDSWYHDKDADTREQSVYYLTSPLVNGASKDFIKSITIDNKVVTEGALTTSTEEGGYTTITTTYEYDGQTFNVELEVDAVQTHNAVDAIRGAWGVTATTDKADDGNITSINGKSVN